MKRIFQKTDNRAIMVKVYANKQLQEFETRLYIDGKMNNESTYYTADYVDALEKANELFHCYGNVFNDTLYFNPYI
jgi:hypothetical protein